MRYDMYAQAFLLKKSLINKWTKWNLLILFWSSEVEKDDLFKRAG